MTAPIVTFDCYRTLIDFDLNRATLPIVRDRLEAAGVDIDRYLDELRVLRFQGVAQAVPYRRYQDIVRDTLFHAALLHGIEFRESDAEELIEASKDFAVFPEVPAALEELKALGYEIAIISNSDDDLIPHHVKTIGVDFTHVITAEQAGAYKPRREAFDYLLERLPQRPDQIIHAAQGWEYDIMPTKDLGLRRRVWINRYGLTGSDFFAPYDELSDLSGLPGLLGPAES